jgi:hypothetical protein
MPPRTARQKRVSQVKKNRLRFIFKICLSFRLFLSKSPMLALHFLAKGWSALSYAIRGADVFGPALLAPSQELRAGVLPNRPRVFLSVNLFLLYLL